MKLIVSMVPLLLSLFYVLLNQGAVVAECPVACATDYNPVCGTDGKTYPNLCNLNVKQCQSDSSLAKLFDGECECRQDVACTQEYDPYCGTDTKTYGNRCNFALAKLCNSSLSLLFIGECACREDVACTTEYEPHCGTDGTTYGNKCTFAVAKLCSTTGLQLAKLGKCGNTTGTGRNAGRKPSSFNINVDNAAGTAQPLVAILVAAIMATLTITH